MYTTFSRAHAASDDLTPAFLFTSVLIASLLPNISPFFRGAREHDRRPLIPRSLLPLRDQAHPFFDGLRCSLELHPANYFRLFSGENILLVGAGVALRTRLFCPPASHFFLFPLPNGFLSLAREGYNFREGRALGGPLANVPA